MDRPSSAVIRQPPRKGFTAIELLIVVSVIAVVLSISLVAIRSSMETAARAAMLSQLRQHSQAFGLYSADYQLRFPLIMKPGQPWEYVPLGGFNVRTDYFGAYFAWPYAMARSYYGVDPHEAIFRPSRPVYGRGGSSAFTCFWYSNSFLADPKFWRYETRTGPDQWRATRQDEVRFASKKVLIYNAFVFDCDQASSTRSFAFVDGSCSFVPARSMLPAYANSTGPWPGRANFGFGIAGMHTLGGVQGRDIN